MSENVTKWMLFQCPGGARWSSVSFDDTGKVCTFSGCNCGGVVQKISTTELRRVACDWFRRPGEERLESCAAVANP